MTLRSRIGSHPLVSIAITAWGIYGLFVGWTTFVTEPRCKAVLEDPRQPQILVSVTMGIHARCTRQPPAWLSPVPSEAEFKAALAEKRDVKEARK